MSSEATARDLEAYQRWCATQSRRLSPPSRCQISAAGICTGSVIRPHLLLVGHELEPEEVPGPQRQQVRKIADLWEMGAAEQLHRMAALVGAEIELHRLRRTGDVVHAQDQIVLELPEVGEDAGVGGLDRLVGPKAEHRVLLA